MWRDAVLITYPGIIKYDVTAGSIIAATMDSRGFIISTVGRLRRPNSAVGLKKVRLPTFLLG